jgi:hypothetical protein
MRLLHSCVAVAVLIGCAVSVEAAAGKKGNKGSRPINGVITAVTKEDGKDTGTITVQVQAHKKKGQASSTPPAEKTFQVSSSTKFAVVQKVKGQKGQKETMPTTFANVFKGDRVLVRVKGDVVEEVQLVPAKKKK